MEVKAPLYENKYFELRVVVTPAASINKPGIECYGLVNKETGVVEEYITSLSTAKERAETEAAYVENEWWRKAAAQRIEMYHAMFDAKLNS